MDTEILTDSSNELDKNTKYNLMKQMGGFSPSEIKEKPTGSFPPIYIISKEEIKKETQKQRLYAPKSKKIALSIKEIMQERKNEQQ